MAMDLKDLPVRYLGVPLISTKLKAVDCECIKDRMLKRVSSWTSKKLSYAGRIQLVVSVLHGIQAYWSSIFILPKKVLHEVEDILRRFIWSGPELNKNGAKVAWADICCPHKEGGLGIKDIVVWNKASMVRHIWDLARKKDSLWVKWCHQYRLKNKSLWGGTWSTETSWTWNKLMKLRSEIWDFIKYKVGNGESVWCWFDNWHSEGPLYQKFGYRIVYDAASNLKARMKEFIVNNDWVLPRAVSSDLVHVINQWPAYRPSADREDEVIWTLSNDGEFSVKSVWERLRRRYPLVGWHNLVWHKDSIPRCSFICWLACRNRLRTKEKLFRWGVIDNSHCVLCGNAEKTRDHLFFQCSYSKFVWQSILANLNFCYQCSNWEEEVDQACRRFKGKEFQARLGRVAFSVTVYFVWMERNSRIFQGKNRLECVLVREIENFVVSTACRWSARRNYCNWVICRQWGLSERVLAV